MEENLDALLNDYVKKAQKQLYSDKVETREPNVQKDETLSLPKMTKFSLRNEKKTSSISEPV